LDFKAHVRQHLPPLVIAREPEIVDELALHLADLYNEAISEGLDQDDALARATSALPRHSAEFARALESASRALPALVTDRWRGNDDGLGATVGSARWPLLSDLRRDIRYAVRMLARTPGFTFVVCLILALGIGANAVIFSAVDAVLLHRAPVADSRNVVSVFMTAADGSNAFSTSGYPDYMDLKGSGIFADIAAFASIPLVLDSGGLTQSVSGELVTGNYFDVLGVKISNGRSFTAQEDQSGTPVRVVVLSYAAWTNRFGGDPAMLGRTISLNGNAFTVVGITPRGFTSPILGRAPEIWTPAALQPELRPPSAGLRRSLGTSNMLAVRGPRWMNLVARLRDGTTAAAAAASADVIAQRLAAAYPQSNRGRSFTVVPLGEGPGVRASAAPLLKLLAAAVVLVLVIACANVASLLLVRAVSRRREVAVRIAVGAGRGRLVRQWLTESVLLALAGAAGGLVVAAWGAPLLHQFGIPETVPLVANGRVLLFAVVAAVTSGVVFGLAPVLQTFRKDTVTALRDEGGAVASGSRGTALRSTFVVIQVALSVVLLVGAGLFLRTLYNATSVNLGYDIDRVLVADINLDVRGYSQEAGQSIYSQVLEKVNAIPGVQAAAAARVTVLSGSARTTSISSDGRPVARDGSNAFDARANVVSDQYLEAMGIRVTRGRDFLPSDRAGAPRVAMVSEKLAQRLYPGADPVGRPIVDGDDTMLIVGVVPDTVYRSGLEANPLPFVYAPLAQNYESGMALHIRTAGDPLDLIGPVRQAVRSVDPQLVVLRPAALREVFQRSIGDQRMMAMLVGLFGVIAVVLAAVGLYGVMAHMARQRATEIGIRMALGAEPASILRLMLRDGLRLVALGSIIGLAGALAGARYVQNQLFGVEATDPMIFGVVWATLMAVSAIACLVPARRAMRVDPVIALRST